MALLECRNLTKRFGALVAVDDVTLDIQEGEIHAVIGPNGAGKSTFFNLVTGMLSPTAGTVRFAGEDITGLPAQVIAQRGIARTFQLTHLMPGLTARENVRLAAQARDPARWHILGGSQVLARASEAADRALERLHISQHAESLASALSHGDQRLLEIAMALAQDARLLMLDEPTQGWSIEETDRAVEILRGVLAGGGVTVMLVEHDMEVVFKLADKIAVLHQGRIIADDKPEVVRADKVVQDAYLGGFD
ncbi:MAG: ABC transporter ATP-binding protein [Hyphomicrobiaceae bacterium]